MIIKSIEEIPSLVNKFIKIRIKERKSYNDWFVYHCNSGKSFLIKSVQIMCLNKNYIVELYSKKIKPPYHCSTTINTFNFSNLEIRTVVTIEL